MIRAERLWACWMMAGYHCGILHGSVLLVVDMTVILIEEGNFVQRLVSLRSVVIASKDSPTVNFHQYSIVDTLVSVTSSQHSLSGIFCPE